MIALVAMVMCTTSRLALAFSWSHRSDSDTGRPAYIFAHEFETQRKNFFETLYIICFLPAILFQIS